MASERRDPLVATAAEIRRGATRLSRRLRAERPADALSGNKLIVLSHLYRYGPTTPGRLAAAEHQRPQSLTRVFAELEQDGLIFRAEGAEDRRQSVLDITAAGLRALGQDMAHRDEWLAAALADLSETEREVLRIAGNLMDRLADSSPSLSRVTAGPPREPIPEHRPHRSAPAAPTV